MRLRPQPQHVRPRVRVSAFQRTVLEIGAARELFEIVCPGTGRIQARQRGVEQGHGLRPEDLLNQGHDLRPDRLASIEQQNSAAQFVELLDLHPLPCFRSRLALRARGEPADGQRGYFEGGKSHPVLRDPTRVQVNTGGTKK